MTTQTFTIKDQKSSWKFAGFFIQNIKIYLTIKIKSVYMTESNIREFLKMYVMLQYQSGNGLYKYSSMSVGCISKNQAMETQLREATVLFRNILLLSEPNFSCQMIPADPNTFRNPSNNPKGIPIKRTSSSSSFSITKLTKV